MAGAKTPNGANASVDAGLVWLADTVVTPARVRSSQPVCLPRHASPAFAPIPLPHHLELNVRVGVGVPFLAAISTVR
jgi:hypothetical protein